MAIKKSDLYSSLWASCDELRGGRDASQNKDYAEERQALKTYAKLFDQQTDTKTRLRTAQDDLEAKLDAKYPTLTGRIRQLAERHASSGKAGVPR